SPYCFAPDLLFFTHAPSPSRYTLSLHDALPISHRHSAPAPSRAASDTRAANRRPRAPSHCQCIRAICGGNRRADPESATTPTAKDRKSTRLNSSHVKISYAVFCLKKKNTKNRKV